MTGKQTLATLDRLIRVRKVRARQAMAALGRNQARAAAETNLHGRVLALIGDGGAAVGAVSAAAANARAASDALLGALAADSDARLAATNIEQARLAQGLARARAAVDAAIARRSDREAGQ